MQIIVNYYVRKGVVNNIIVIVAEEFGRRKWTEETLTLRRKGDPVKVAMAERLRRETTMVLAWIAARLRRGTSR